MTLSPEAVDRIIDAVEHWGDVPGDPIQTALNYAWSDCVDAVLNAWKEKHGEYPSGRATMTITMDGEKIRMSTNY